MPKQKRTSDRNKIVINDETIAQRTAIFITRLRGELHWKQAAVAQAMKTTQQAQGARESTGIEKIPTIYDLCGVFSINIYTFMRIVFDPNIKLQTTQALLPLINSLEAPETEKQATEDKATRLFSYLKANNQRITPNDTIPVTEIPIGNETYTQRCGQLIRSLREARGYKQAAAADLFQVTQQAYSTFERSGIIYITLIYLLCEIYRIRVSVFIKIVFDPTIPINSGLDLYIQKLTADENTDDYSQIVTLMYNKTAA